MKKRTVSTLIILTLAAQAWGDALPTPADLQQLATAKDWKGLMQATARVLALQGPATAAFNRVDVWMLKAEAQLQSNLFFPASQSFTYAAAEKNATPEQKDLALASAALVKLSDHKGYQPKPTNANPNPPVYDIFDPAKRKEAIAALFAVQSATLSAKIDRTKTLNEGMILDLAKQAAALAPLDRVGNGSADKSDALQKSIGDHFVANTQTWHDASLKQLEDLNDAANKITRIADRDNFGRITYHDQKAGLTSTQFGQIRQLRQQAQGLAHTYQAVTPILDDAGKTAIEPAKQSILQVYDRADTVEKDAVRPA